MTTHLQKRCQHCRVRYSYQASGWGAPPENHHAYCPSCYTLVMETLSKVPQRVERFWDPTDEVTFEQLQEWEPKPELGKVFVRRVLAPLFDMEDPSNRQVLRVVSGKGDFAGRTYYYEYWTKTPDQIQICMETELDLETGEILPWYRVD